MISARPAPGLTRRRTRVDAAVTRPVYVSLRGLALTRPRVLAVVGDLRCFGVSVVVGCAVFERLERHAHRQLQLARLDEEPFVLDERLALKLPRFGTSLGHHHLRFAARLLFEVSRCTL